MSENYQTLITQPPRIRCKIETKPCSRQRFEGYWWI